MDGRGPTKPGSWGRKRSLCSLTAYKSWDDAPSWDLDVRLMSLWFLSTLQKQHKSNEHWFARARTMNEDVFRMWCSIARLVYWRVDATYHEYWSGFAWIKASKLICNNNSSIIIIIIIIIIINNNNNKNRRNKRTSPPLHGIAGSLTTPLRYVARTRNWPRQHPACCVGNRRPWAGGMRE